MMAHAGNAGAEDPSPFGPAEANELLCSVPEEGGHSPRAGATPFAPNLSKINSSPAVPHDHGDRTLKRSNSKSVRFSNTSSDDEDDSPGTNPDMRGEGGRRWRSLKEFCQVKEIYRGRVSLVASAVCKKSNQGVVLKAYIKSKLSSSLREMVEREIRVHGRVKLHDGVVEFLGWFEDEVQIVLVQEHCSGGDLYRHLVLNGGQMSEDLALREVMYPMIHALLRIHRMNICHRDLKPENMFFAVDQHGDRCLKLGDFGLASDLLEMRDRVGTLDYMAPEILLQRDESSFSMEHQMSGPEDGKKQVEAAKPYTVKVDVWAVGIIAYELLTGRPPFEVSSPQQTAMLIVWGEPQFPDYVSNQARDFIQQALQKNPDRRPTMVDLVQHPWIANYKCRLQDGGRPENSRTKFLTSRCSFKVAPKAAMQMEGSGGSTVSQAINGDPNLQSPGKSLPPKPVLRRAATSRALECAKPPKAISRSLYPALTQSQPRPVKPNPKFASALKCRASDDSVVSSVDLDSAGITRQGARKSVRLSGSSQVASEMDARSDGKRALRSFRSPQSILKNCESEIVSVADIDAVVTREFTKSSDSQTEVKPQSERSMVILRKATLFSRFFSALMCGKPNDSESDFPASPHFPASPPQSECQPLSSSGSRASLSNCRINSNSRRQSSARPSETSEKTEHSEGVASEASSVTTQHTAGGSSSRGRAARSRTVSMAINVSRLLSRWMDDGAPWNTGAQHFKNMDTLAIEPRPEELEDIQRHSASSTRKRFMEYMIRRGGHTEATRQSLAMENMPKNLGSPACAAKQFLPQGQATVSELGSEVVASVKMMGSCHRDRQSRQTD